MPLFLRLPLPLHLCYPVTPQAFVDLCLVVNYFVLGRIEECCGEGAQAELVFDERLLPTSASVVSGSRVGRFHRFC